MSNTPADAAAPSEPRPSDARPSQAPPSEAQGGDRKELLFDITKLDLGAVARTKAQVEEVLPHRGVMSLIDHVVYHSADWMQSLILRRVRGDEFWCAGHFPNMPTFPGVLMVETAAQLSALAFMSAKNDPSGVLFLRIENCAFRLAAAPGTDLFILCQGIKMQKRRFITDVQGVIFQDGSAKIAFGATLSGMTIPSVAK